jgi:hypothetical protein
MSIANQSTQVKTLAERIGVWAKTTRIQTAMVTSLAIWLGWLSSRPITLDVVVVLTVIGLLVHVWGFTMNEIHDYEHDRKNHTGSGHPIAQGLVDKGHASLVSSLSGIGSVVIASIANLNTMGVIFLGLSFIPGYMYNKWSKEHWWSNIYLSLWAILMVLSGAGFAGQFTQTTYVLSVVLGIQIFVQVIEGDIKDIVNGENTFTQACGVDVVQVQGVHLSTDNKVIQNGKSPSSLIQYSVLFTAIIYGLKLIQLGLLIHVATTGSALYSYGMYIWIAVMAVLSISFITTVSMFLVYNFDRDYIKKKSSIHEITSIFLIAASVYPISKTGSILILVVPPLWYFFVNVLVHSGMTNPDI